MRRPGPPSPPWRTAVPAALVLAALSRGGAAQEPATAPARIAPGRFIIDSPTPENPGFRWYVEGDGNRNASVAVSYRKKGDREWEPALPMLRVHHEVANQDYGPYRTGNLLAGSVLFLEPATQYIVRFVMEDPACGRAPPPWTRARSSRP